MVYWLYFLCQSNELKIQKVLQLGIILKLIYPECYTFPPWNSEENQTFKLCVRFTFLCIFVWASVIWVEWYVWLSENKHPRKHTWLASHSYIHILKLNTPPTHTRFTSWSGGLGPIWGIMLGMSTLLILLSLWPVLLKDFSIQNLSDFIVLEKLIPKRLPVGVKKMFPANWILTWSLVFLSFFFLTCFCLVASVLPVGS